MTNQVKDEKNGKKSLEDIAKEMKEEKLTVDKLKKVQKIIKLIFKEVKEKFLKDEWYKNLAFPENIFLDGENITFSEIKFLKINSAGTECYMDKMKNLIFNTKKNKILETIHQHTIHLLGKLTYYLLNANHFFVVNTLYINTYPEAVQYFLDVTLRYYDIFTSLEQLNKLEFFKKEFGDKEQKECMEIASKVQSTTIINFNNKENEKGNEIEDDLNDIVFSSKNRNVINYSFSIIPDCVKKKFKIEEKEKLFLDNHKNNEWKNPFDKKIDEIYKKNIGC